ncbi:hypothetical protein A2962_03160 [Candidatus Woesebacteria bacterium RIFCSPLOWO2_01_FULL_39_61]|uniref:Uncharacterized protein n=1 Tax=Candidatus Woesebacteria bacterium RIFCSPHIGHO2_02_FULL_39_13 TaxID=1802505 RepID=A0A1F7Z2L6_9BACT|nr:MAG: hypothetical protein A2692_04245 [Candidatus Woesebacteria bacterium RIFCSPHIGHO2_01_FULL_39_95]OGM33822.1 MAG: hypothetical protein A3D01_02530 [Candidatus Woesebacteria bacterium RIFCSPHIGHO2_02_FULL_39_13]OGM38983.1 MAG: hypothetical protein A3E13_04800 [Candidatus Woesebacteria bacterium RIFCSPHIGHO2_12_FULL_40_20]OGM67488.1 MAG: hypothetical protein A2962_03160 [Candidatus Woesebacteria bacterium RIFCSPLOWO2_01_FULL_39_61]OGM72819.1 MAG: hypothetical protein A3H19_05665 [Candidatus
METREFNIHHPLEQLTNQAFFDAKIERNKVAGRKQFSEGDIRPFQGYPIDFLRKQMNFILELDEESRVQIIERVARPLSEIAQRYNVPSIFTGFGDLPPHITLQPANFLNMSPESQQELLTRLKSDKSHLDWISKILRCSERTYQMNTLVLGGNMYVCTRETYPSAYKARKLIERIYTRGQPVEQVIYGQEANNESSGLIPVEYKDIIHISVGRVTEKPSNGFLSNFADEAYETVEKSIAEDPVSVRVNDVFVGPSIEFFEKYATHLILK